MEIYILRHGIAIDRADHDGPDSERPLTSEGRRKLRRVAEAMRTQRLSFDAIYTSPLVRACQTAEIIAEELRARRRLEVTRLLSPATSAERQLVWLESLGSSIETVLLVGHEPNLSGLISHLLAGRRFAIDFKKAGLCAITIDRIARGRGILQWLLTPKQMEKMK